LRSVCIVGNEKRHASLLDLAHDGTSWWDMLIQK
jgi:hypothetical protein